MTIIKGNTKTIKFKVVLNGQNIQIGTGDKLTMTVKKSYSDANALFVKTQANMTYDGEGYIVTINPADTENIPLGSNEAIKLYYDVKFEGILNGTQQSKTLIRDTIDLQYSITK